MRCRNIQWMWNVRSEDNDGLDVGRLFQNQALEVNQKTRGEQIRIAPIGSSSDDLAGLFM